MLLILSTVYHRVEILANVSVYERQRNTEDTLMKIGVKQYEMRHVVRLTARCNVNEINNCTVEPLIDSNRRNSLFFPFGAYVVATIRGWRASIKEDAFLSLALRSSYLPFLVSRVIGREQQPETCGGLMVEI